MTPRDRAARFDEAVATIKAAFEIADHTQSKEAFEHYIREFRRPDIGDDANDLTEADFILDLAEPGWPDSGKWLTIWCRLNAGGELTPREREQALVYYKTEDGAEVPAEFRLVAEVIAP